MGRTPIPVAESTRQPPEREVYTSGRIPGREESERGTGPLALGQTKGEPAERDIDPQRAKGVEWALPTPMESRRPPREDIPTQEEPFQGPGQLGEGTSRRGYPTPEQQLVEADKRRRRKLATLARDHIMKLREERHRLAQGGWKSIL